MANAQLRGMRHTAGDARRGALRWRAYLISVVEDRGDEEVAVYCPECADRKFGDRRPWRLF